MKLSDLKVLLVVALVVCTFLFIPAAGETFRDITLRHGFILSFFKFAILATFGESLALRITTGYYNKPGFGIFSKMIVWGILGLAIKAAFVIFYSGTPAMLVSMGLANSVAELTSGSIYLKVFTVFAISTAMNTTFAPVMMTMHKITDIHIAKNKGKLLAKIDLGQTLTDIDWKVMWNFVFKKTLPFFWIPAHTITFLLPPEYQILVAALLGMALGLSLAIAGSKK